MVMAFAAAAAAATLAFAADGMANIDADQLQSIAVRSGNTSRSSFLTCQALPVSMPSTAT
jgi:hypothetical protein